MVADPTNASKGGRSARGRPFPVLFPDEVADQEAGKKGPGKCKQDQERPGQDSRRLEDHLAHGLKVAARGQERGRLDVDRGQDCSDGRVHWRLHGARLGRNDRRKFGRWRRLRQVRLDLDLNGIAGKWLRLGLLGGRSRGSDALAGRDDEVHELGLNPDVFGTEGRKVIRYRCRDLFHE